MKHLTLSQAFTVVLLALVVAIIPACGGSGGSGGNATGSPIIPPPPAPSTGHIHTSTTVVAPVILPPTATVGPVLIRSLTFTPTNTTDVIMYVQLKMVYSYSSASSTDFTLTLKDASGNVVTKSDFLAFGSSSSSVVSIVTSNYYTSQAGATPANVFGGNAFYTLTLEANNIPAGSGGIVNQTTFTVVALEGVTVSSPSAQLN